MSADVSKDTLYVFVAPPADNIAESKVTMYLFVRPTGAIPGPARRRRVQVSSRIVYALRAT